MSRYRNLARICSKLLIGNRLPLIEAPKVASANFHVSCRNYEANNRNLHSLHTEQDYEIVREPNKLVKEVREDTVSRIENLIEKGEEGRLFAVIHVCGKQFKVTADDLLILEGYWPPQIGDRIRFEKVLLAGGADFTLVGRPVLPQSLVTVIATVIEKDLSHTRPVFYKRPRKQYMRLNFHRAQQTMLRINEVSISPNVGTNNEDEVYSRI